MKRMLENYINGNLTDARKQAERFSMSRIKIYLMEEGWSESKAHATAAYLKGVGTFQAACDAK